jgi:hypothetical protein
MKKVYVVLGLYADGGIEFCSVCATQELAIKEKEKKESFLVQNFGARSFSNDVICYERVYEDLEGVHKETVEIRFRILEQEVKECLK